MLLMHDLPLLSVNDMALRSVTFHFCLLVHDLLLPVHDLPLCLVHDLSLLLVSSYDLLLRFISGEINF